MNCNISLFVMLIDIIHLEIFTVEFLQSGTNRTGQVLDFQMVTILIYVLAGTAPIFWLQN